MTDPTFTIITPSYNQGRFIEETIKSVLSQTYPNIEYIIIDGGSNDDTVSIIKNYEKKIDYWVSEKDNGQTHAINKGLLKSTGEIIMWLNSDDVLLPGTIEKVVNLFLQNPEVNLIHGTALLFGDIKEQLKSAPKTDLTHRYLAYIPFPQPASFFRRKLIEEQGLLDEKLHYAMDFDLLVRAVLNYNVLSVQDTLAKYRIHPASKTNDHLLFAKEWAVVFSKVLRSFDFSKDIIDEMKSMDLYTEGSDLYSVSKHFSLTDLELAFFYFIDIQMHYHYQVLETKQSFHLAKFILNRFPMRQTQANSILLKSLFFPKFLIRNLRKFT